MLSCKEDPNSAQNFNFNLKDKKQKKNYIETQHPLQNPLRLSNEPLSNVYILIRLQLGKSLQNVKKINNELLFFNVKPEHPVGHNVPVRTRRNFFSSQ